MWTDRLTASQAERVLGLAGRAEAADGVRPLNEAAHFGLQGSDARHLLIEDAGSLLGYCQWEPGYRTAQLVVDPQHRRRGIGRRLLGGLATVASAPDVGDALPTEWGAWAFGDLPAAQGFALALRLVPARGLLVMERPLDALTPPEPPEGLTLRGFTPEDESDFLAVNAAAFAHHPEQGALDAAGFAERAAEPWFDPSGLILAVDAEGLAGFHWTKLEDGVGEVYVIGVAPRVQGRGYGRVLLQAGLAHLASAGADRVRLYVDMAEPVAVRMYESAGFRVASRDVLYAPQRKQES